jgi:hypothetical protein
VANGSVECCVIQKLCHGQPAKPLGSAGMNFAAEVGFQALVQPFSLAIRLWMVRETHHQLDIRQSQHFLP